MELLLENIELVSALFFIALDLILTRCNKVAWKGAILRILSLLGKAAQSQVDKGTKNEKGNVDLDMFMILLVLIMLISMLFCTSCALTKNIGDGTVDATEESLLRGVASAIFAVKPSYVPAVQLVTERLIEDMEGNTSVILLSRIDVALADRIENTAVAASAKLMFSDFINRFVNLFVYTVLNGELYADYDVSAVIVDVLKIINSESKLAV